MSKKFTLDDIRDAAEEKYGSTILEFEEGEVELVNVLRLPKEKRKVIMAMAEKAESEEEKGEDTDEIEEMREQLLGGLCAACRTDGQAKILTDNLGHDTALVASAFQFYTKGTQVGEASPSQD